LVAKEQTKEKARTAAIKQKEDQFSHVKLNNPQEIRKNLKALDKNQVSILKDENRNRAELHAENEYIMRLANEQKKLELEYKEAKDSHSMTLGELAQMKKEVDAGNSKLQKLRDE
jgi:hypothetical protein